MISDYRGFGRGMLAGLLTGAIGVCVGFLVAGLTGQVGSPVVAVASAMIDISPPSVKDFAIREFGSQDKLALQIGVVVLLAIFAAVIGALAVIRLRYGLAGVGVFALVGLIAAATRPTATLADLVPTIVGSAAAAGVMYLLVRAIPAGARAPADRQPATSDDETTQPPAAPDRPGGQAEPDRPTGSDRPTDADPATAWVPAGRAEEYADAVARGGSPFAEPARRSFLALGAGAAAVAGASFLGGRLLSERQNVAAARSALHLPRATLTARSLPPGVDFRIPGLSPFVTPDSQFYRVDTAIVVPEVPPTGWHLRIHGMVTRELTISFRELLRRPLIEDWITLCCVSNPVGGPYIGNAKWLGASLGALLREAGIKRGADQLFCTSVDGFNSGTPVQTAMDGRDALLAIGMNGQPLPTEHGFPVRTVIPGLYGYVSACKWITDIEVTTYASNAAYWAQRGWLAQAPIKTESRIDVPADQSSVKAGASVIAGVAWAQHKGIDAVEVKVDNGPWQQATLAAVPGIDTWRQWKLAWNAVRGSHVIQARATDATGYTQTAAQAPPPPNGASGYPAVQVTVA